MVKITLAVAKGRPANETIRLLEAGGIHFVDFHEKSRKLVFYNEDQTIKLLFVKAVDVPTYVERGAADIGIVGKDNILESQADFYEMHDLKVGKCKISVAGYPDFVINPNQKLIVATKYPNITKKYFSQKGQQIETVLLNGSVELAPLIGLADVIVDIVETGNTLRENGLSVLEDIESISTRLIVNKASFATKANEVQAFILKINEILEG
ncbi:ATP phosphoribosyltransferase [Oceanobacillus sp. CAU 1775]